MWAHSSNERGEWHVLSDHALSTAELAQRFAAEFRAGDLGYALGLFHDAGKACSSWQDGLRKADVHKGAVGVPHKQLGAHLLSSVAGPAALAILGHHGGLTELGALHDLLETQPDQVTVRAFLAEVEDAERVLDLPPGSLLPQHWRRSESILDLGIRLAFSALVDADHLDTAAHFAGRSAPEVRPDTDLAVLRDRFEAGRAAHLAHRDQSPLDDVRRQVYRRAIEHAAEKPGIFRMPAPTGVGKTLAAGGFALHHAAEHGMRRVIVAVPFITVTEQNAGVYRSLLGPDAVLEHHSAVRPAEHSTDAGAQEQRLRAAVENWDSPFVVTTTVQLFDSLFGRKSSQMRKLHRLANAVVVLDEVQALPLRVLTPILDALRILSEEFGTTVLLTSATQPSFQALDVWSELRVHDVVDEPRELFRQMRRVVYRWWLDPRPTLVEVAEAAVEHDQVLVVVNTIADAREIYQSWAGRGFGDVFHLSTRMYPGHRRRVLATVQRLLSEKEPVRLVSTQLIEAGVDVDFPVVFRAFAPAEALQQAAGRANREGRAETGLVVVFDAEDMSAPSGYRIGTKVTGEVFGQQDAGVVDPDDLDALDVYYRALYQRSNAENGARARAIQDNRRRLDFLSVAEGPPHAGGTGQVRDSTLAFRMLDDDTVPVVVTEDDGTTPAAELVERLARHPEEAGRLLRRLQPFVVSLPRRVVDDPAVVALCRPLLGDLYEWRGSYDRAYGLDTTGSTEQEVW
ncbi:MULTISPECIES: CRISPR-associated helicase/endonuclease Cas3 [Actinoalloteichus]|uniref:CRISPR-associated helicase, Cas3 family n=1 Tax=Actinoalloteichus fjordicus TaxID=1612552 RepID=A0AAC9PSB2_9PSEU|nr:MULTISPECIES: CRISPR-associated helicase/endonuclease Cas3 [Actinoalloteichus]APU14812.1 CRISPR-associated helicase, Cas3 family [Actinoalloteichus fjordicus]APU20781.1 CRISPR-associated helicase, Cas3 family [Actinoalloteichus sp. GBA129-24]